MFNNFKKKIGTTVLGLAIVVPTTMGVVPMKIGSIESQQSASAAQTTWT